MTDYIYVGPPLDPDYVSEERWTPNRCCVCGRFMPEQRILFCSKSCGDQDTAEEFRRIEAGWL